MAVQPDGVELYLKLARECEEKAAACDSPTAAVGLRELGKQYLALADALAQAKKTDPAAQPARPVRRSA
jgi:hypothetical protein